MIASLPMYDFPEAADANDRLWNSIRAELAREGIEAPAKLEREAGRHEVWRNEKLLLSQTCGLPFRKELHNSLTLVGTPDCELEACEPGYYRSVFVASNACAKSCFKDFDDARLAFNGEDSQSGWAAPMQEAAANAIAFSGLLETGSHEASAYAVFRGNAEIAAIDASSWKLFLMLKPWAKDLKTVGFSRPTPGLPFVTSFPDIADALFHAVRAAVNSINDLDKKVIPYRGLVRIAKSEYLKIPPPARPPQGPIVSLSGESTFRNDHRAARGTFRI